jgi:thiamine biosynthesis lipoprotein
VTARRRRRVAEIMGTVFSLDVPAGLPDPVLDGVLDWLRWVDATFSTYRPDSAVSRLRRGEAAVADCPPEVAEVLALCAGVRAETSGWFDAGAGPRLDPSGLVKGWSVQRASDRLRAAGCGSHCFNGGGDVYAAGHPAPDRPWRVGIADPLTPRELLAVVSGTDLAVATSGTAERGEHVWDPFTGRPAGALAGVTVVGPDLARADGYATAAVAMQQRARDWRPPAGYALLGVTATGERWQTADWPALAGQPG